MQSSNRIVVQEFLDSRRFGSFQWKVLLLCATVVIMDGFDIVAMGFIAPALIADWHIPREALGPVLSASLLGLAIGGMIGGPLADKFGRRKVIVGSVFFFGLMSLISAWSPDLTVLTLFRFLTGLGLGASQPNAATLAAEYAPKRYRSIMVTTVYSGFSIGAAGGGFLASYLIPHHGWQSILIVGGGLPMAFAVVLAVMLPESAKFLAVKQASRQTLTAIINAIQPNAADDHTEYVMAASTDSNTETISGKRGAASLLLSSPHTKVTIALWVGVFMNYLTVYFLSNWLPVMVKDQGMTITDAAIIGAMLQVGGIFGNVMIGWEMDRWNPNKVMMGTILAAAIVTVCVAMSTPGLYGLMLLCFLLGLTINCSNTGWTALATSYYPTEIRATGTGWMTAIGRFGAIFGVSVGAVLLGLNWELSNLFLALTVPMIAAVGAAYAQGNKNPVNAGKFIEQQVHR